MPLNDGLFSISRERNSSTWSIMVAGDIDRAASRRLLEEFDKALASDAAVIVVDLTRTTHLNRTGLHVLAFMRRCAGSRVRFIPSPAVARVVGYVAANELPRHGKRTFTG
jgi:anti-anti-sigma regulatory factor